ncbi:MAG: extracellular solute-binding protein [Cyanobacteria bacterium J06635_1]
MASIGQNHPLLEQLKRIARLVKVLAVGILAIPGCGEPVSPVKQLTFWTFEVEPERLAVQQQLAEQFDQQTGIQIKIVPIAEDELTQQVENAMAIGRSSTIAPAGQVENEPLPDVLFAPLETIATLQAQQKLDTAANTTVINTLGTETFANGPLTLVAQAQGEFAAVPADGWGQLLLYRQDLFAEKQLPEPSNWQAIAQAAQTLNNPSAMWGIQVPTDPTQGYTQQVFEQFALSNGCQLVNISGNLDLNSPNCITTLEFYKQIAKDYTPPGNIYWLQTRQDLQAGTAAMVVWSPFILDELAGLRNEVPVTDLIPPLHKRIGIVTTLSGPDGAPAQWGQVNYFAITTQGPEAGQPEAARPEAAQQWVQFLLSDGYLDWLSMAPEGKFPLRPEFVNDWKQLEIGVDSKAKIADLYSPEVIDILTFGVENFDRWGFAAGKGNCAAAIYNTQTVTQILHQYINDEIDTAEAAAQQMQSAVMELGECSG